MTHKFVIELVDDCKGYEQDVDYLKRIYGAEPIKEHDEEIYNKAIDDFAERIIRYVDCGHLCSPTEMRWSDLSVVEMVKKLAEQLKE